MTFVVVQVLDQVTGLRTHLCTRLEFCGDTGVQVTVLSVQTGCYLLPGLAFHSAPPERPTPFVWLICSQAQFFSYLPVCSPCCFFPGYIHSQKAITKFQSSKNQALFQISNSQIQKKFKKNYQILYIIQVCRKIQKIYFHIELVTKFG